ncbi:macrolide transporter [Desulfocarbo indianensis]|nr:macrolide transporter [Desulfocarbo indianensis]
MSATPLIELRGVYREYPSGEDMVAVLKDVNLTITAGEMVAIIGTSGSGKSTLMNLLGCLDRPTRGAYLFDGRDTGTLDSDELARLRREHFGFIFQRYHLLSDLSAVGNVEVPAIYAGRGRGQRRERGTALLRRLGLGDRLAYRPGQLSGGQQQRVSIARALMNGGRLILADEPTGALDRRSGQEMMELLEELHREGHTVVIVTHDPQVAAYAQRIIEISDGEIISDRRSDTAQDRSAPGMAGPSPKPGHAWSSGWDQFSEAMRMALLAMGSHRLRTFLTMLGIIIGIASVVSVVALGEGSQQRILKDISSIGTNTIEVFPGKDFGDERSGRIETLVPRDADALRQQPFVDSVTPKLSKTASLRYRNLSLSGSVIGVGEQYFRVRGYELEMGRFFDEEAVKHQAQEAVIDHNTLNKLFAGDANPVGKVIILGTVPARVVGVTKQKQSGFGNSENLQVWVPYTTAMWRVIGQSYLSSINVRVNDQVDTGAAEQGIIRLLTRRHGLKDFFTLNTDAIRQTIEQTTATMRLLISAIALISLVVGGIGVMNIMLVSVTERTREIGVRMAVGARRGDIMRQFLVEAVLVCLCGGVMGIVLALLVGVAFSWISDHFRMIYSTSSILAAFACATMVGVVFGYLPAKNAAQLDPVEALARE